MDESLSLLQARLQIIEANQNRMESEVSLLHSDFNIERGFNRLFRVVMIGVVVVLIGMVAWLGFTINSISDSILLDTRVAIRQELLGYQFNRDSDSCSTTTSSPSLRE